MEELENVAKQTGTAILDFDGKVIKATGDLAVSQDASAPITLAALYHILQDASKCLENESLRKITVLYSDHNFVLMSTEKNICIAKIQTN